MEAEVIVGVAADATATSPAPLLRLDGRVAQGYVRLPALDIWRPTVPPRAPNFAAGSRPIVRLARRALLRIRGRMKQTLSITLAATAAALLSACAHPGVSGTGGGSGGDAVQRSVRDAIAREQSLRADTISVRTLGVTPLRLLTADTTVAPLAFGLADIMMTDLARSSQLIIVDRVRLETLLDELKLVSAGRVDSASAPRVGRLVGARRLVLGSIGSLSGRNILIDARIADVADGTVRPAVTATAPLADILAAEKELVFRIFGQLNINLTPAERATISERQTGDLAALLAYGRAVRFETEGRFADAEEQYAEALRIDPAFRLADLRLREVRQLRRSRGSTSRLASGDNNRPSDALLAVLQSVNRSDVFPLGGRGAGDPSFPLLNGTLIIIITAHE
ncbi:MAG: CsgG/HfaB family protein [Gemmatimonadota bacterium]|nr:CsgG/HfaB family protein [Gemmatimonadota bacterium]